MLKSTEFWSAILGAVVGGAIAFGTQLFALREARKQRADEHAALQKALAHSLLFKLRKIHSNIHGIHRHFWETLKDGQKEMKDAEPWQVVVPLANPPPQIHLTADEMGMLLALKDDPLFNDVLDVEAVHNSLIGAVQVFNSERATLGEQMAAVSQMGSEHGNRVTGVAPGGAFRALRPKMMGVNALVEGIISMAKDGLGLSNKSLTGANTLFRAKLNLAYKLVIKPDADISEPKA